MLLLAGAQGPGAAAMRGAVRRGAAAANTAAGVCGPRAPPAPAAPRAARLHARAVAAHAKKKQQQQQQQSSSAAATAVEDKPRGKARKTTSSSSGADDDSATTDADAATVATATATATDSADLSLPPSVESSYDADSAPPVAPGVVIGDDNVGGAADKSKAGSSGISSGLRLEGVRARFFFL